MSRRAAQEAMGADPRRLKVNLKNCCKIRNRKRSGSGGIMSTATSQYGFHPDAESLSAIFRAGAQCRGSAWRCSRTSPSADVAARWGGAGARAADAGEATAAARLRNANASQFRCGNSGGSSGFQLRLWPLLPRHRSLFISSARTGMDQTPRLPEQNPTPSATPASAPTPTEQAKVEPPAAAAPATPPSHTAKHAHSAAPEQLPAPAPPVVAAQMPSESEVPEPRGPAPGVAHRQEAMREPPPMSHGEEQQSPPQLAMGNHSTSYSQPGNECAGGTAGAGRRASPGSSGAQSRMRGFKAKSATSGVHGANAAPPGGATETVTVTAPPTA